MTDTKAREGAHTPGPWKSHSCAIVHEDGREIAVTFPTVEGGREEGQANARLIAAAPDLYAALKNLLKKVEHVNDRGDEMDAWQSSEFEAILAAARAALAKAKGVA